MTQLAFPEYISNEIYATTGYNGNQDTANEADSEFLDSINANMASVTGNTTDGYVLTQNINILP